MKKKYQKNIENYNERINEFTKELNKIIKFRLAIFLFSIFLIIILAYAGLAMAIWIIILLCALGLVHYINEHNRVSHQKDHVTFLRTINEREISRLDNNLNGFSSGSSHIKLDHPYVADLDVFGSHSLFQLINRTTTESGENCLAAWLSESAPTDVILERQKAIQELSSKLEWRQDFQASGMHFINAKSDFKKLLAWLEKPESLLPRGKQYLFLSILLGILSTLALIIHFIYAYTSVYIIHTLPLVIILGINYFFLKKLKPIAEDIIVNTHQNVKILGAYEKLIGKIEHEKFNSRILQKLQMVFNRDNFSAVNEINKLREILEGPYEKKWERK